MKTIKKYILLLAVGAACAASLSSCWNKDYYMLTDDDTFYGGDFMDDRSIINGEFELDDMDR